MKQLPVGVYAVSSLFTAEGDFRFKGETWRAQPGVTGFHSLEELAKQPLEAVQEPFMGYENVPVILIPKGNLPIGEIGKTNAERFRVVFPRAVAILGENAGLDANHHEDMTQRNDERDDETVLQGSFYFGAVALTGECDGTLTLDGLTLGCRVQDLRTGGENVGLVIKNCIISANITGHNIQVSDKFEGHRTTHIFDSRATDMLSMNGEGNIFYIGSGDVTIEDTFVGNTDKIVGMSNYAGTAVTHARNITLTWVMFQDCTGDRCLTFCLPDQDQVLTIEQCTFWDATRDGLPPIRINRTADRNFTHIIRNEFLSRAPNPCVLAQRDSYGIFFRKNICYGRVLSEEAGDLQVTPPRRTAVDPLASFAPEDPHEILDGADFTPLDKLYAGKQCLHGDFHCHSNSGGTSDGKTPLAEYVPGMDELDVDFAAIVDHRQMRHFFLPEWDEARLICGTEPGCMLNDGDRPWYNRKMDYTMIFPDKTGLARVMEAFPQFKYTGGTEGTYVYAPHTREDMRQLGEFIWSIGGLMSHAHPKQLMVSDDPLDYYFGDHVALETVHGHPSGLATKLNHRLWVNLLELGKRVRTHGSSDSHGPVSNRGLTTLYCEKRFSTDIFNTVRSGNCAAGAVGIKLSIDDAPMGSVTKYTEGQTLYVRVGDFHRDHRPENTVYSLRIYTDCGLAWAKEFAGEDMAVALPVQDRKFYRVEVYNESDDHIVAISNPIWLDN